MEADWKAKIKAEEEQIKKCKELDKKYPGEVVYTRQIQYHENNIKRWSRHIMPEENNQ